MKNKKFTPTFKTNLMDHQERAVRKLDKLKVGALFMEMGTGKTRTALEIGLNKIKQGKTEQIIWLCPVSVKLTIAREIEKHLGATDYELVDSRPIQNKEALIYICGIESVSQSAQTMFQIYSIAQSKKTFLVVDESSLIKNYRAKRTRNIWRLGEVSKYRFILNGTPVTNTEQDLYCQWYLLDKRILGYNSYYSFAANHLEMDPHIPDRVIRAHNVELLTRKISPYTYQVKKNECLDLPPKTYSERYLEMNNYQLSQHEYIKDKFLDELRPDQFNSDTILRLFSALQKIVSGHHLFREPLDNPRVKVLIETIREMPDEEKVIIWCKYVKEIEDLKEVLADIYGEENVTELWGGLSSRERNKELERFEQSPRFLVANKSVGAFGLNLQFCKYAIYYSNDFNWATRSQSEDRIHRVGQTDNVHIIDIITEHSIDERIQESIWKKENLVDSFKNQIDHYKDMDYLKTWLSGGGGRIDKDRVVGAGKTKAG